MPSVVCIVVHPSPIIREGLRCILANSQFEPVYTATTIEDVPITISAPAEQVLVLVGVREAGSLAQAVSASKVKLPTAQVVVVADCGNCDVVMTALQSGATSIVDADVTTPNLIKKLELVAQGEPVISTLILKRLLANFSHDERHVVAATPALAEPVATPAECGPTATSRAVEPTAASHNTALPGLGLSGREAAILKALGQGAPNKVIADRLKISEATVKVHVKAILRKIGVKNRTQAAIWGLHQQALPLSARSGNGGAE